MNAAADAPSLRVITASDEWETLLPAELAGDVYYRWNYLAAWAREEGAEPIGFHFEKRGARVVYPALRMPLDALPGGPGHCDLRTPYDFGGPRVVAGDPHEALRHFDTALRFWCARNGVVTEFARLHPLALLAVPDDATLHAENFVVDLRLAPEAIAARQDPRHRTRARHGLKLGLKFELLSTPSSDDIDRFTEIYSASMRRVKANEYFFFSRRLFAELIALDGVRLGIVHGPGGWLAAAIFVDSKEDVFYFLSGTSDEAREAKANDFLLHVAIEVFRRAGKRLLHLGGGSPSLRHFKEKISTGVVPYFVLRRIHDLATYARLASGADSLVDSAFPVYLPTLRANQSARTR